MHNRKPYDKKLKNWHKRIRKLKDKISKLPNIKIWNIVCGYIRNSSLKSMYDELDEISAEVQTAVDIITYSELCENSDNDSYLSQMTQILYDVESLRESLYIKDINKYKDEF